MERKDSLIAAIASAIYGKVYPEAEQMLATSFGSAYSQMKKSGFPTQARFQEMFPALYRKGRNSRCVARFDVSVDILSRNHDWSRQGYSGATRRKACSDEGMRHVAGMC